MSVEMPANEGRTEAPGFFVQLQRRGVIRVGVSYAVIAWLTLQIGDVVLEPLAAPEWALRALIVVAALGLPVALALAWFLEITPAGITVDTLPAGVARPSATGLRRYADVVIIGALLIAVAVLLARESDWFQSAPAGTVVGVLPFTELGEPAGEAYLGAGIADTLTYKLGRLPQLTVLAPSSTFQFRGQGLDLQAVGAKLGATALLEGTVLRTASMLRVNARLVDIGTGQQLWSGSLDRPASDLFAVQDEVAQSVASALELVLSPRQSERLIEHETTSLSAYDAYLKARAALASRASTSNLQAVAYLREATRLDPDFALAWGGLVEALYLASVYRFEPGYWNEVASEARAAAGKAQSLEPDSGEAWLAQAFVAMGDNEFSDGTAWPESHIETLLRKAVELSPSNAVALKAMARYLDSPEEKLAVLERAAVLDPMSAIIRENLGSQYSELGRYEEAMQHYVQAIRLVPDFAIGYGSIYELHVAKGELDQAARWARVAMLNLPGNPFGYFAYSSALAQLAAWDALARLRIDNARVPESADEPSWRLTHRRAGVLLGLATSDCDLILASVRGFRNPVPGPGETWADVSKGPASEPGISAWALCEWFEGRPETALELLQAGIPDLERARTNEFITFEIRTNVLHAALLKATGKREEAQRVLARFLEETAYLPVNGEDGIGFGRFFANAVAGDADAAIEELQVTLEAGYLRDWWMLDLLEADPDFAAMIADPRFVAIMTALEARVAEMRERFFAEPDLDELTAAQPR